MRWWIVVMLVVGSGAGLGLVHPFGDPRVEPAKGLGTLLRDAKMPAEAKAVLVAKCADCHSSETRWPVYAWVAPGSWLVERDVVEARRAMDLSRWEEMPVERREVLMAKIAHEAKSGEMPPVQYRVLHWGAGLSATDVRTLAMLGNGASEAALDGVGDAARGKIVFEKRCTGCHAMDADREGPRLGGVFGRKAGSVAGFALFGWVEEFGIDLE